MFCVSMLSFHFQRWGGSARSNTWPLKLTLHKVAQLDFDQEYRCKLSSAEILTGLRSTALVCSDHPFLRPLYPNYVECLFQAI